VNFLYDDIVRALQNTIDWYINFATYQRGCVLERRFTKFSETQCNGHYAVQGHSRSPILVSIESAYDFLLVINTLHRFQVMADYRSIFFLTRGDRVPLTLSLGLILCQYHHNMIL